jgi:hypothetical protein
LAKGESKHTAAVYISELESLLSADLVYNQAHLYLQERRLESWLTHLNELEESTNGGPAVIRAGKRVPPYNAAGFSYLSRSAALAELWGPLG